MTMSNFLGNAGSLPKDEKIKISNYITYICISSYIPREYISITYL